MEIRGFELDIIHSERLVDIHTPILHILKKMVRLM